MKEEQQENETSEDKCQNSFDPQACYLANKMCDKITDKLSRKDCRNSLAKEK
jgi:hypothetical protein